VVKLHEKIKTISAAMGAHHAKEILSMMVQQAFQCCQFLDEARCSSQDLDLDCRQNLKNLSSYPEDLVSQRIQDLKEKLKLVENHMVGAGVQLG